MRVLVTGSSGQIGTNLALRLLADGHDVVGLDKRPNPWTNALPTLLHDLSDWPALSQATALIHPTPEIVVHLAAHSRVHELVVRPHHALENIVMTFGVLEYVRRLGVPLLFTSSREVYGDIHRFEEYDESLADFAYTESPYSASKIAGEALVYAYARCYSLRYLVFRLSNVYGRFDNDLERLERVVPLFIHRLSRREPITIYGPDKLLDFTYVDDCIDGIARGIRQLVTGRVVNETINLAYGEGHTLIRLAELIAGELGVQPEMMIAPPRLGEVTRYVANTAKARTVLAWKPQTPLAQGVPKGVAWFLEHTPGRADSGRIAPPPLS